MNETLELRMKIFKYTIILSIIIGIGSIFALNEPIPFLYGLAFGTLMSILNFSLLAKTVEKAVTMDPEKAKLYMTSRYSIRFFLYGVVLFVSIQAPYINVLGTIVGILSIKAIIYAINIFNDKEYFKRIWRSGKRSK